MIHHPIWQITECKSTAHLAVAVAAAMLLLAVEIVDNMSRPYAASIMRRFLAGLYKLDISQGKHY